MKPYVIIGNGVAAAGCIEGIRSVDPSGPITVISEEKYPVYCRPLISYYLEGKTDLEKMNYRDADFYQRMGCEVIYGKKAVQIQRDAKTVSLDDGSAVSYSSLCVAAGSSPVAPPFAGLDTVKNRFFFMTIDDMRALETAVHKDSRVLIIGAGLIGLKCAEGLQNRAGSITVCDLADRILSSILDAGCAAIVQRHLEANGIRFLLSDSAERFEQNTAFMKSGRTVGFDVLVLAIGVRANTSLVGDAGGEINRGILIDNRMQTSIPGIFAAGDCTEGEDISLGGKRVLAILPNAYLQGHAAGVNMAGGNEIFDKGIPMNSIGFFGLHMMTAGSYFSKDEGGQCFEEKAEGKLKRLYVKNGLLTGFILVGETGRSGILTSLIREKTPLNTIDFEMLKRITTTMAFSPAVRRKKFGGVV